MDYKDDLQCVCEFFDDDEYPICKAVHVDDSLHHDSQPINISSGYVFFGSNEIHLIKQMATIPLFTNNTLPKTSSGYFTNKNRFFATRVLW